ncbi:MAG: glycosyltransferase family 39 protein [Anaerolineae bacterium]|nr:glycosyltransferase family 39 protein [Phycisphaerae bacterium]
MLLLIAAVSFVPPVNRFVYAILKSIRRPAPRTLAMMTIGVAICSGLYLYFDAIYQKRSFQPKYHDEFSYMIQTRMVAQFRLWAPAHPLGEFFETFQVINTPVYASVYFPGAAMMYAPGVWLSFPPWVMPLVVSSLCVGMVFLIVARLIGGGAGLIAALMLLANPIFRLQSLMVLAQAPALLLMLIMIWAWLNWRQRHHMRWAAVIGIAAGWCAITRPLDALCVAITIGAAMLFALRDNDRSRVLRSLVVIVIAAAPFLILQLGFNRMAGRGLFKTPFARNIEETFPQTALGFRPFDPNIRPRSTLPQKQAHYDKIAVDAIKSHTVHEALFNWGDHRLRLAVVANAPTWLMIALMPAGLLGIFEDRRKLAVWLTLPLFVALYIFYPFYLAHYVIFAALPVILNILAGADVIARSWPRRRKILTTFFALALSGLSISEFAEFNRIVNDEWFDAPQLTRINQTLAALEHKPAVVLFRWSANAAGEFPNSEEEPVYNSDVVWPDQALVIRAHDLGEWRNGALYRYYAQRSPDRAIYLYDRGDDSIRYLGTARELAVPHTTGATRPAIMLPAR